MRDYDRDEYLVTATCVGCSYIDDKVLKRFERHQTDMPSKQLCMITFQYEPDNQYNPLAVMVMFDNTKIGYIKDTDLKKFRKFLEATEHLEDKNTIIWLRDFGRKNDKLNWFTFRVSTIGYDTRADSD